MSKMKDCRLCQECSLVTVAAVCPLCDAKTIKHPEANNGACTRYCGDCAEEFPLSGVVVVTWDDDPFSQIDDGSLLTICRECSDEREEEFRE